MLDQGEVASACLAFLFASSFLGCSAPSAEPPLFVDVPGTAAPTIALVAPPLRSAVAPDPEPIRFLPWEPGRAAAQKARRPLFVFVHADWSARALEIQRSGLWSDPSVQRALAPFVAIDLDATSEDDAATRVEQLGAKGIPSMVFWDPEQGRRVSVAEPLDAAAVRDAAATFLSGRVE